MGSAPSARAARLTHGRRLRSLVARGLGSRGVQFALIGGALFIGQRALSHRAHDHGPVVDRQIVITSADLDVLRRKRAQVEGTAAASGKGDEGLIEEAIDEEVLYREGRALIAGRHDPVIERRLAGLARYLELGGTSEEVELDREMRSLGLDRGDPVIRRYLIELMRLALARPSSSDLPDVEELARFYERSASRFTEPPRIVLTQVYLSRERRGAATEQDAARLLDSLRHDETAPEAAAALGDPFFRGAHAEASPDELARAFGPSFAAALDALPLATWSGPVQSSYGLHLVWVHERRDARVPPLDAVRGRVVHAYLRERGAERMRSRLRELRRSYQIEVEREARAPLGPNEATLPASTSGG